MPQVLDIGGKVAVDFDCPSLQHNADERDVPFVELRRCRPCNSSRGASRLPA